MAAKAENPLIELKSLLDNRQYDKAIALGQSLEQFPQAPAALYYLMGRIYEKQQAYTTALNYYQKALDRDKSQAYYHLKKANTLKQLQKFDEAKQSYEDTLAIDADNYEANFNYANLLLLINDKPKALKLYDTLIAKQPTLMDSHINKCNLLLEMAQIEQAQACVLNAIKISPTPNESLLRILSNIFIKKEDWPRALSNIKKMKALWPDKDIADIQAADVYFKMGHYKEAKEIIEQQLAKNPTNLEALQLRFNLHFKVGTYKHREQEFLRETIKACQTLIDKNDEQAQASALLMSDCYAGLNELEEAFNCIENVNQKNLGEVKAAREKQASLLIDAGKYQKAEQLLSQYNSEEELRDNGIWGKLGGYQGNWQQYWQGMNENYAQIHTDHIKRIATCWDGSQDLSGKTLLVICKWGIGDIIQMSRFCINIKERHPQCRLQFLLHSKLVPLYKNSPIDDICEIIELNKDQKTPPPICDYYVSSMAIAECLKLYEPKTFWPGKPYLTYNEKLSAKLRKNYQNKKKPIIGFSWFGGFHFVQQNERSIALSNWKTIINNSNSTWLSVQYGDITEEVSQLNTTLKNKVLIEEAHNTYDELDFLAAQIMACDLIISIDNSTVHLSGALGKETWVLLPYVAEVRWSAYDSTTPWYPNMKLFRQPKPGDWDSVIHEVESALKSAKLSNASQ